MTYFRIYRIAIIFCLGLLFPDLPFSAGQDVTTTPATEQDFDAGLADPFKITVNVREVRLDVVVLDGRGRPITDLAAEDFEIYQDRQPQEVTSSVYISDQMESAAWPAASQKTRADIPLLSTPIKKEEVRRTIIFVVDNISMSGEDMYRAKTSLKGFVERQMQPGDLVAIMCTGYGNSAQDAFLSDKRQLLARIDGLYVELAMPDRIYGSQLSTLSYGISALEDMPGRKSVFLVTSAPTVETPKPVVLDPMPPINYFELYGMTQYTIDAPARDIAPKPTVTPVPAARDTLESINYHELYDSPYSQLSDEALRAGVVIHLLDTKSLEYYAPTVPNGALPEGMEIPPDPGFERADSEKYSFLNPLPAKTGGIYVKDSNFFLDGIGQDANSMIAGYYLISYTPPPDTFDRNTYHRLSVKVKRRGAVVHTRDGFYGITKRESDSDDQEVHPLQNAIFSPFQHTDLGVNIAAGFVKSPKSGYFICSWIHLDAKDVKMVETEEGARIDIETVVMTSGLTVKAQDLVQARHIFDVEPEKIAWIQEHGIRFFQLLPVKKPGSYTVRIAVQDEASGRIGTAYQFVEIPDLNKSGLALSDIFMITRDEDLSWVNSDAIKEVTGGMFFPVINKDDAHSPALRAYAPGDSLQAMAILYNADAKAISRSEIETQSILYKDGVEFSRNEPKPIAPVSDDKSDIVPIMQRLTLGSDMPPGRYTLQLRVTDKKDKGKKENNPASQTLSFTVR